MSDNWINYDWKTLNKEAVFTVDVVVWVAFVFLLSEMLFTFRYEKSKEKNINMHFWYNKYDSANFLIGVVRMSFLNLTKIRGNNYCHCQNWKLSIPWKILLGPPLGKNLANLQWRKIVKSYKKFSTLRLKHRQFCFQKCQLQAH